MQARYQLEHARYLRLLRKKLQRAQGVLATRLVEIYKSDQPDCVTVVLEADGFNDLLVRADYLSRIGEQDSVIVDRVRTLKEESPRKKRAARDAEGAGRGGGARDRGEEARARQRTRRHPEPPGATSRARATQKHGALGERREQPPRARGRPGGARGGVGAGHGAAAGRRRPAPAGPIRQGSGGFIWPVNGPVVSRSGCAGAACTPASTSPCRPARRSAQPTSGTVAIAGWMGGYGNYTCIEHGGGIATCYGAPVVDRRERRPVA